MSLTRLSLMLPPDVSWGGQIMHPNEQVRERAFEGG